MRLFYSTSSPFARKVRIVAREKGIADAVVEIECNPFADPAELRQHNQLSKVPTLIVANDLVLYDSPVICEYLDSLAESPRLLPREGRDRWLVLRAQALADGLLDLAVALTLEGRRLVHEQSALAKERWREQIRGALDAMQTQLGELPDTPTLGHAGFGAALGYLDFRHPDMSWRKRRPKLTSWFEVFAARSSMKETLPSDSSYLLKANNGIEPTR